MPIPIEQHIRLAELRKKLEGKLKITDSGPDSLGVELLPGNDDALPEFHQLLDLLKEIMQSKTPPQILIGSQTNDWERVKPNWGRY